MTAQIAPQTADGWAMLHQFYALNWSAIKRLASGDLSELVAETVEWLSRHENKSDQGQTNLYHVYGHKGDLLFLHYRKDFDLLAQAELEIERLRIAEYLKPTTSYLSVVELGLYYATINTYEELSEMGLEEGSKEWHEEFKKKIAEHKDAVHSRCYTELPQREYVCFYPMNKRRGEHKNWYALPLEQRGEMMMEHGKLGRKYAGRVQQIISGSIGFDDWEWGVDLHVDFPNVAKELVYEMRFDEGSALYGEFGPFYFGKRLKSEALSDYLNFKIPPSKNSSEE
ncbi:MAG: heme-dependent peroxidase [Candidatus Dadabacteria bacterium]|nr:MAG: heme-dependent peroxidase [Candidatus Dadabacteria bacterium]